MEELSKQLVAQKISEEKTLPIKKCIIHEIEVDVKFIVITITHVSMSNTICDSIYFT